MRTRHVTTLIAILTALVTAGPSVASASHKHRSVVPGVANAKSLGSEPSIHGTAGKAPTTLIMKDLVVGTGASATKSSSVQVKYIGASWRTGKDFTSQTWSSKSPATFSLTTVVPGFAEGVAGMKVGGRREIVIPAALGYGSKGAGGVIKPNETLVFVVDLLAVK